MSARASERPLNLRLKPVWPKVGGPLVVPLRNSTSRAEPQSR